VRIMNALIFVSVITNESSRREISISRVLTLHVRPDNSRRIFRALFAIHDYRLNVKRRFPRD